MPFVPIFIPLFGFVDPDQLGILIFFLGGLVTAISPCLFPILPLSLIKMFGAESRKKSVKLTTTLVSGIVVAFLVLTIIIYIVSDFLRSNFNNLNALFGMLLVIIGIFIMTPRLREISGRLPGLKPRIKDNDESNYLDAFILGLSYSMIAAPCAGTVFASLIFLIASGENILFLLFGFPAFALGLALPYYVLAFTASEFRFQIAKWLVDRSQLVNMVMGSLLILFGIGMILPLISGVTWWSEFGDDLTAVIFLALCIFGVISMISYAYRRRKIETIVSMDKDFSESNN